MLGKKPRDIESKSSTQKFIFVDWLNYFATNNESPIEWFYRQIGLDSTNDQFRLHTNLDCTEYTTIIFDHFDWAMREQHTHSAKQLVLNLARPDVRAAARYSGVLCGVN